jgi:hypothetical protein
MECMVSTWHEQIRSDVREVAKGKAKAKAKAKTMAQPKARAGIADSGRGRGKGKGRSLGEVTEELEEAPSKWPNLVAELRENTRVARARMAEEAEAKANAKAKAKAKTPNKRHRDEASDEASDVSRNEVTWFP